MINQFAQLTGKTAWITGGKRIGQVVAKSLAEQGVNIIMSYRSSAQEAEDIVRTARNLGVSALAMRADTSRREDIERAVGEVREQFKRVEILINMASVFQPVEFSEISQKDWDVNYSAHILGTFWPSQLISEMMPSGGHIINVADRTSIGQVYPGYLPYVVTKAAIAAMTRALAVELAGKGIFVNAIAPGPILRPHDISEKDWQSIRDRSSLKYQLDDDEAANQFALLVLYLSVITTASGHVYPLDQGQNL